MWQTGAMPAQTIPVDTCSKMVESATRSCQPLISVPPEAAHPNWDAIAVSLTSQSNAIAWGAIILAVIVAVAGFAWGRIITLNAEKEAREMAEKEVKRWLQDVGLPMVLRNVDGFLRTFPREQPISEDEVARMVTAAGADGKEGDNGKK